jgi:hypothetical protein
MIKSMPKIRETISRSTDSAKRIVLYSSIAILGYVASCSDASAQNMTRAWSYTADSRESNIAPSFLKENEVSRPGFDASYIKIINALITNPVNTEDKINYGHFKDFSTKEYCITAIKSDTIHNAKFAFTPLNDASFLESMMQTVFTAKHDLEELSRIDTIKNVNNYQEYALKNMMQDIHQIMSAANNPETKIIQIYDRCSKDIVSGELTKGSASIADLILSKDGDCNDLAPAYYAIYTYLGFDAYLRFGKHESSQEGHAWIGIRLEENYFDLDPTWNDLFVAIPDRNPAIPHVQLKERYVKRNITGR